MSRKSDFEYMFERFIPIEHPDEKDNYMFETYGEDLQRVQSTLPNLIWTIVDGSRNKLYAIKGMHFVDRLGYLICEKPWTENDRDYLW